ncbi:Protein of unknown function, partial [Gryllus bimaculatus]
MTSEPVPQPALATLAPLAEIGSPGVGPLGATDGAVLSSAPEEGVSLVAQPDQKPATPRSPGSYEGTSAVASPLQRCESSASDVASCITFAEGAPSSQTLGT